MEMNYGQHLNLVPLMTTTNYLELKTDVEPCFNVGILKDFSCWFYAFSFARDQEAFAAVISQQSKRKMHQCDASKM